MPQALAQWKTRTHIQKYVYDISSQVLTTIYVSAYYYVCVLVLLYRRPHTTMCVLILVEIHARTCRSMSTTSPHRYYYMCVFILLNMCPHTTIYVSSY